MKEISLKQRRKNLEKIKRELKENLGNKIQSAIVYGCTLRDYFSEYSDYDILLIMKNNDYETLKKTNELRKKLSEDLDILLGFNMHTVKDIPENRKELFWHNNRGYLIQKEMMLFGEVLIGENVFNDKYLSEEKIKLEALRMTNTFVYETRKHILNNEFPEKKRPIIKYCIYSMAYSLSFFSVFPFSKKDFLEEFPKYFKTTVNPERFFYLKENNPSLISEEDIKDAYLFLSEIDEELTNTYFREVNLYG